MRSSLSILPLLMVLASGSLLAVTLEELERDSKLTPKRFANYFSDFRFEFHAEIQPIDIFLRSQSGDCDDYAILADRVLRPKGYETRLVCVRMPGLVSHDVCYVGQEKGYLDYNNRVYWLKIEKSGPSLREIATKVAKSFSVNWTSASEFTYPDDCLKHLIRTIAKTDPPDHESQGSEIKPRIKINF